MKYLLGMDAGGTKTLCVLADEQGNVIGMGRSGCGNFQVNGRAGAQQELKKAVEKTLQQADIEPQRIEVAFYGISGADREEDFLAVHEILEPINPAARMFLENDTTIALRAGTQNGLGLGLISGTGTNAIGFNGKGQRLQVGGWGSPYLGDYGSAHDIAADAFALAQRGWDERGRPTLLYEKLVKALGVKHLIDISERDYFDSYEPLNIAALAPLVFEAAREGDRIATDILEKAGREIALSALTILRALFQPHEEIPVVLGGSVFQKGNHPAMVMTLENEIRKEFPLVKFTLLDRDPVVGALLFAADRLFGSPPPRFPESLINSYNKIKRIFESPSSQGG